MKVFTVLLVCICCGIHLNGAFGDDQRQLDIFHHHTTRIPLIHRIRERLTSRPIHYNMNNNNQGIILGLFHRPLFTLQTTTSAEMTTQNNNNLITDTTIRTTTASTSTSTATTNKPTNSISTSTEALTTTITSTTLSPARNSQSITPPFFLTTSSTSSNLQSSTESAALTVSVSTSTQPLITTLSTTQPLITTLSTTSMSSTSKSTQQQTTMTTTESKATTTTMKDPCANRMALYANGALLVKLCYIDDQMIWPDASQYCTKINYRLFEINSYLRELSMFNYFKSFAINQEFHWINGIAEDSSGMANWYVYDPKRLWNYTTTSWFGLVQAPVPGMCLGIIFISGSPKLTDKDCETFQSTFWCEYL